MKFVGITRIRNESKIIQNTLNHVGDIVDEIYVYDDCSEDDTVAICNDHSKVKGVIEGKEWNPTPQGRAQAEGGLRQQVHQLAVKNGADWIYYFDSDEYLYLNDIDFSADSYSCRLFDFYITPDDVNEEYLSRQYMGPEYRDIPMIFRVTPKLGFRSRIPNNMGNMSDTLGGYIKHYGKAISVEEWEKTCDYYINHRWKGVNAGLLKRWKNRKGKAIHTQSDFNRPLITWEDRFDKSIVDLQCGKDTRAAWYKKFK